MLPGLTTADRAADMAYSIRIGYIENMAACIRIT